ncbi:hypothetical protein D9611_008839 [Ephemerocybe angulata]|uniref:Glycosyltransferase family 69 protein n=1 Tax=Ephemerocybe angulata TaxID=980116 RepID=A0A8H5BYH6_9AGAR|nr:hypothetical protein D9611_008839 [Tulosesus angulatus]
MFSIRRRSFSRLSIILASFLLLYIFFYPSSSNNNDPHSPQSSLRRKDAHQIKEHNFIERATRPDKTLNVQKHPFLQARMGRDERDDAYNELIYNGVQDYWERFQLPYIVSKDTINMDTQHMLTSIDQLLSLNGWVGHLCPTLTRPFGQHKRHNAYEDIVREDHRYYIAIVVHSADHFLVDQLAVIVQMARRLGTNNLFVSMLDYDSSDSTSTLLDLSEAVLTLLGVPFRIRRVPGMTEDPQAAYYPLEEAYTRNLALEPLHELHQKRGIVFDRVVWLKGFTCPDDILETIKISYVNEAAMVCGMDWAEHNGFFIFSDRWRTRDIEGDQFRQSKSSNSKPEGVPPRDKVGAERYAQHLPFQVFCCESGMHVVDPGQSYYKGVKYRAGEEYQNMTKGEGVKVRDGDANCLDSSQAWFCRDLWVRSAGEGMEEVEGSTGASSGSRKRDIREWARFDGWTKLWNRGKKDVVEVEKREVPGVNGRDAVKVQVGNEEEEVSDDAADSRKKVGQKEDPDANAGSDYDAMPEDAPDAAGSVPPPLEDHRDYGKVSRPNSVYRPARILVNPRCPTTYAGVSHTKLARDLFGEGEDEEDQGGEGRYVLEDWEGAPESFVCQEQRQTGGRKATKTQRRLGFSIHDELEKKGLGRSV